MSGSASSTLRRLCTALCLLLTLVFGGTSAAGAVDRFQHPPGATESHVHLALSAATIIADAHHADGDQADGHDADDTGGDADRSAPDHAGHHHADGGSGLPPLAAAETRLFETESSRSGVAARPLRLDVAPHGPERPPKASHRTA